MAFGGYVGNKAGSHYFHVSANVSISSARHVPRTSQSSSPAVGLGMRTAERLLGQHLLHQSRHGVGHVRDELSHVARHFLAVRLGQRGHVARRRTATGRSAARRA